MTQLHRFYFWPMFKVRDKKWPTCNIHVILQLMLLLVANFGECQEVEFRQEISVYENQSIGILVGILGQGVAGAHPPYSRVIGEQDIENTFNINTTTGKVTTRIYLDRETKDRYLFYLRSNNDSAILNVNITVLDVNDNRPQFSMSVKKLELSESTPIRAKYHLDSAMDPDVKENSTQGYEITEGNIGNVFGLTSKRAGKILYLELLILGTLDYEQTPFYSLLIRAYDGGTPPLAGLLRVNITILDTNDNQPIFNQSQYFTSVPENATIGTSIVEVFATDQDSGESGKVRFSIDRQKSDPEEHFIVDPVTGVVKVNKKLDYETQSSYSLVIIATDNGSQRLQSTTVVAVTLQNINELPATINLVFLTNANQTPHIPETASPNDLVARISVSDPDAPGELYDHINVTLQGGGDYFKLLKTNNVVYLVLVKRPLDREKHSSYNLTIIATDSGTPPLYATLSFILWIDDSNDNAPLFTERIYQADIQEVAPPGASVIQVTALDPDDGVNSQVTYSIARVPGTHYDWFQIDNRTGLITTRTRIDCEVASRPELIVVASDSGKFPLSSNTTVIVTIHDVNDNQPLFDQSFYSVSIPENTARTTCILTVSATDHDCGSNAQVTYHIASNQKPVEFSLNSTTGRICVNNALDYERQSTYEFAIQARDKDGLDSTAVVKVQIQDINDNRPEFYPLNYNVNVQQSAVKGAVIVVVEATDRDSELYGTVHYQVYSGNDFGYFTITPYGGVVSLSKTLPSTVTTVSFTVLATDGGGLTSQVSATVSVTVVNADSNPPIFDMTMYRFTMPEDANIDRSVGEVRATTTNVANNVRYSIVSGDRDQIFRIDAASGTIYLNNEADHDTNPRILLNIQASVGTSQPVYATCQVNVTISDVNDNAPIFGSNSLEISVKEDTDDTVTIYAVEATDRDSGKFGNVRYRLLVNPFNIFRIDTITGEIRLYGELDYERQSQYKLIIEAYDEASTPLRSNMTMVIDVQDVNDNIPIFTKDTYNFDILENVTMNTKFSRVSASDLDTGNNGRIMYKLARTPYSEKFGIFSTDGYLYVRDTIDRETDDVYILHVVAMDDGTPIQSATAVVQIQVLDVNDNTPVFTEQTYSFTVVENQRVGTTVGHILATDRDIEDNGELLYAIVEEDMRELFSIHSSSGDIMTVGGPPDKSLDREVESHYQFTVSVRDKGETALSSTAMVKIQVLDLNDNKPVFQRGPFEEMVTENQPKGTSVVQVIAKDPDMGENGTVSYSLAQGTDAIDYFDIHPKTGWITTKEVLDYEVRSAFILTVKARDGGHPAKETSQEVKIRVEDDNDGAPYFPSQTVTLTVVENVAIGHVVGRVTALDRDSGENGRVSYYIVGGNIFGAFYINTENGDIQSIRDIDYEEASSHTLGVKAIDNSAYNPKSTTLTVIIDVIDVNDNTPAFDQDPIVRQVKENTLLRSTIYTFAALDLDSGVNGTVSYTIVNGNRYFEVDSTTGQLKVASNIDYESLQEVSLIVRAQDRCPYPAYARNSTVTVVIIVLDVNDNFPSFSVPTNVYIFEDEPVNFPIMNVFADDADSNHNNSGNGVVSYRIVSGNDDNRFNLQSVTGLLTISHPLDRETTDHFTLNISGSDHGQPQRVSFMTLRINVEDVNDIAPLFNQSIYKANVQENMPLGTDVTSIHATDKDTGENGRLTYLIPDGIADNKFSVDAVTGLVQTNQPLDRENQGSYIITAYVRDNSYPVYYDLATIIINITDMNDNSPTFSKASDPLTIPENLEMPAIRTLVAFDEDSGLNGLISYTITDGDVDRKFSINNKTGQLSCQKLDRETVHQYNLTITASDHGNTVRSSQTSVVIIVHDQNDNRPLFTRSGPYLAAFDENANISTMVVQVTATDLDAGLNKKIIYSLGNSTDGLFKINNETGRITTAGLFDREKKSSYTFEVMATDQAPYGPMSSTAVISVTISDVNDNAPIFTKIPFTKNISQNLGMDQAVIQVSAEDKDGGDNGRVSFQLASQPSNSALTFFKIDSTSGQILTRQALGPAAVGYHNIQVIASDHGQPAQSSTGVVEITVGNKPRSVLHFLHSSYTSNITENARRYTVVTNVTAEYMGSETAAIRYNFANGNEDNTFLIKQNTGEIQVNIPQNLDYEIQPRLRLIVVATGGEAFGYTTVWVNLQDINDNAPVFTQDTYVTTAWEDLQVENSYVTQVSATDADTGVNQYIRYNIISGNKDNVFAIYQPDHSGIVTTVGVLDYEVRKTYRLLIEAVDGGSPALSATCVLRVNVVDVNDNSPSFPYMPPVHIGEDREVGSQVALVTANDVDKNPTLTYQFTVNPDDTFSIDHLSGKISLAKPLDYEKRTSYIVEIKAWDTVHDAVSRLQVNVTDKNDNAPVFSQQSYQVTLHEFTESGYHVVTVNATDADSGSNAVITYILGASPVTGFYIDPKTGVIYTNMTLRYNFQQPIVQLVVIARDGGSPSLTAVVAVHVQVLDINSFTPRFTQSEYIQHVPENVHRGHVLLQVVARDNDTARQNRNIDYTIQSGNFENTFQINRRSGNILLNKDLDRESRDRFRITVMAQDRGSPPKNSTSVVTIVVDDVNDQSPKFQHDSYHMQLDEDYPAEQVFINVSATDKDKGVNADISYSITSGNDDGLFFIVPKTGSVIVFRYRHLDYEQHAHHKLVVRASDGGVPRLSAFVSVVIDINDVNEYKPVFPMPEYVAQVKENESFNKSVFVAHANDEDGGHFGIVTYRIAQGPTDLFKIDPNSGVITTDAVFDYETRNTYALQIMATDQGGNFSSVPVIVQIVDEDEFPPIFPKDSYNFTVKGSAEKGDVIGYINATDADGGIAGRVIFSLMYANDYFEINSTTGVLTVKTTLLDDATRARRSLRNRNKRALEGFAVTLHIQASSLADNPLQATTRIDLAIDRTCLNCKTGVFLQPYVYVLSVILPLILIAAVVISVVIIYRRRKRKHIPTLSIFDNNFDTVPPTVPHRNLGPPSYNAARYGMQVDNATTSEMSEHSHHSASSGRGSAEDGEDEEICMINSNNANHGLVRKGGMPDSGIPEDGDNASEPSIQNCQEYLARLGVDGARIQAKVQAVKQAKSVESMHQFSDEGGGEGGGEGDHLDFGRIEYEKITSGLDTEDELLMMDTKDYGFHEEEPQHIGSLSSVVNSEEEYSGSYNWDYLLDWGPQYQPLAHVFTEIARLKDESLQPRKQPVLTIPQTRINHSNLSHPRKNIPPPIITDARPNHYLAAVDKALSSHSGSNGSQSLSTRTSTMNTSMPSLPRSPISHESSFTSPALTPSFTPSLSPLATRSPSISPLVTGVGSSGHSSSRHTPNKPTRHRNMPVSVSSESEQEFQI